MEISDTQAGNAQQPLHAQPPPPRTAGSTVRKDIGVLMFLLAAETAVAGINTHGSAVAATVAVQPKSVCTSDSSSLGDTDSVSTRRTPSPDAEELLPVEDVLQRPNADRLLTDSTVVARVMSYVSWRRAPTLRLVHPSWRVAAETIVQIHPLPGSSIRAPFLPTPTYLEEDTTTEAALQFAHPSTWRCVHCGFWNTETRVLCGNRQCQAPSLTHVGFTRIFVGQLRRDGTVPFLQWLIDRIVEAPGQLRNVENHRHNVTNRGKGCAWAYFRDDEVAQRLLAYHRRMFLDIHNGVEGVWVVPEDHVHTLTLVSEERGYAPHRPKSLPRNALVVEVPATGNAVEKAVPLSEAEIQRQYTSPAEVSQSVAVAQSEVPSESPAVVAGVSSHSRHKSQKPASPSPTVSPTSCVTASYPSSASASPRFHHNPYADNLFFTEAGYEETDAVELPAPGYSDSWSYYAQSSYGYQSHGYYGYYDPYAPYAFDGFDRAAPPPSYEATVADFQRHDELRTTASGQAL